MLFYNGKKDEFEVIGYWKYATFKDVSIGEKFVFLWYDGLDMKRLGNPYRQKDIISNYSFSNLWEKISDTTAEQTGGNYPCFEEIPDYFHVLIFDTKA